MAKTLDTLVTETLGAQLRMILELQAQNEALREQVASMTPPPSPPSPPSPEGAP